MTLAEIRARHIKFEDSKWPTPYCNRCGQDWPCDTVRVVEELEKCYELTSIAEGNTKRIHPTWYEADREKLLGALEFQGATTRYLLEETHELRTKLATLEAAVGRLTKFVGDIVVVFTKEGAYSVEVKANDKCDEDYPVAWGMDKHEADALASLLRLRQEAP